MKREELLAIAKPISFKSEPMTDILDGRKTATRMAIKLNLKYCDLYAITVVVRDKCKYKPGDILYVREPYFPLETNYFNNTYIPTKALYKADRNWGVKLKWKPSIHMPKEAARIFLKVTKIRVEKLQDITYEGCKSEGIIDDYKTLTQEYHDNLARAAYPIVFSRMWDERINKKHIAKYGWKANPYVFVIDFEVIKI